jgi:glycosyltransferase involved in cell wall biosynthesis
MQYNPTKSRPRKKYQYDLSIVVVFFNMRREAQRTLYSLTRAYQQKTDGISYEVIAIDNGSNQPLSKEYVESFGDNFRYIFFDASSPSPARALNHGVEIANGKLVTLCIDGARIFSPGIIHYASLSSKIYDNVFVYTLGMHIGTKPQNYLVEESYSQLDEDVLLDSVNWKQNGYLLFDISSLGLSGQQGFFSRVSESNCITISQEDYEKIGGFDERFTSPGGGLVNLDFFNKVNENLDINPIMLLGEATFHQFHGGTATNVSMKEHPWETMKDEYFQIKGAPYQLHYRNPIYFGSVHPKIYHLLSYSSASNL